MIKHHFFPNLLLAAVSLVLMATMVPADAAHPSAKKGKAVAAAPAGEIVAYEALEQHVGAEIVVETTLNTVHRGTLVKYTNPTLTMQLGAEHGSIELSVPRDTVRSIRLLSSPPVVQPKPAGQESGATQETGAQQETGMTSAKKN